MIGNEERKKAEEEFRKLRDILPQYVCVYGPDGGPLYANDGLLDYFGFTLEGFRADDFRTRAFHPDDIERVQSVRQHAMARGEGWEVESRIRRRDGQYRWFLIRGKPLRDGGGKIVRWFSSGTDIEDWKRAERELQLLVDAVPQLIVVHAPDGRRLYPNQVVLDYFGWTPEEFLDDDKSSQGVHPGDLTSFIENRQIGFSAGVPFKVETRLRRADGQYRWFLLLFNPHRNQDGTIVHWYSTGTDIEERKQAEEALRRSEVYLEEAQQLSRTGSFAQDVAHNEITYWSPQSYQNFGFDSSKGPIPWKEVRKGIHPEDLARLDKALERAIREKAHATIDFRVVLPDGSIKHVHSQCRPVLNALGDAFLAICEANGITLRQCLPLHSKLDFEGERQARGVLGRSIRITTPGVGLTLPAQNVSLAK